MNKHKLTRFISKYHLSGAVNSVVLTSKNNELSTRFITGDKTLLGMLTMKNWKFEDCTLGVYSTDQFLKLLTVLKDDITLKTIMAGNKAASLQISDTYSTVTYMLTDLSVINTAPELKSLPEFTLKLNVDSQFINTFIAGKNALPDASTFTIITDKSNNSCKLVIGYDIIGTNRVTLPVKVNEFGYIKQISFNAELFKNVLISNKECESAILEVSPDGLSKITFNVDDYKSTYYLVSVTT